jgi:peptide/nickel transport system permease protein
MSVPASRTPELPPPPAERSRGLSALAWRRLRADRLGLASLAVVGAFVLLMAASALGLVASDWARERAVSYAPPWIVARDGEAVAGAAGAAAARGERSDISAVDPLAPYYREWEERASRIEVTEERRLTSLPFGADKWGRDVLQKTVKGAGTSIFVGLAGALLATLIGTLLGAVGGYFGGRVGDALEWLYNVFTSIPYILLILSFSAVLRRGMDTIVVVLALSGWTGIYRLVRAEFVRHRVRDYVRAAEALGTSHARRMFVHILPNTSHVILVQLSQHVVQFIKAEVILSFLGLGVPVDAVSWGTMLNEAQTELVTGKWWQLASAGASMAVLVTAFGLLTDALRDALDPRLR